MPGAEVRRFKAVLERDPHGLGWTVARLPFDPADVWTRLVRLRVRGEIGGQAFRTSLFADSGSARSFFLLVNRAMQRAAFAGMGETIEIALEPDLQERPAELPEELDALLDEAEGLRGWYAALGESMRREIGKWVTGVKTAEARMRRAQAMAERMLSTMEGEVELPPAVERALRARPRARVGWKTLTEAQRRGELFAVFYYVTPEAREKRIGKLCDMAERRVSTTGAVGERVGWT